MKLMATTFPRRSESATGRRFWSVNLKSGTVSPTASTFRGAAPAISVSSFRRLADLSRTLYDSGVRDGDTLHVWPESTAGAPQERTRAILRVRREILQYAHQHHDDFRIEHMDDPEFPTLYVVSFRAPGFRPPPKDAPPGSPPRSFGFSSPHRFWFPACSFLR